MIGGRDCFLPAAMIPAEFRQDEAETTTCLKLPAGEKSTEFYSFSDLTQFTRRS